MLGLVRLFRIRLTKIKRPALLPDDGDFGPGGALASGGFGGVGALSGNACDGALGGCGDLRAKGSGGLIGWAFGAGKGLVMRTPLQKEEAHPPLRWPAPDKNLIDDHPLGHQRPAHHSAPTNIV